MSEAKSRPEFADTACNQICVLVQFAGGLERANFRWIIRHGESVHWGIEPMQIEHLAVGDFLKHISNVIAIGFRGLFDPTQTRR